jgi:PBP1b-binding outer membrane lipoprotein LpoB
MIKFKKIILILISVFFLNGCIETAALVGPAITVASSGNAYHAGLTYGGNLIIEKETGQSTIEHMSNIMEPVKKKQEKKIQKELLTLVENRIKNTRLKLFPERN